MTTIILWVNFWD